MSSLQICRLQIGPPPTWHEGMGDPITNLGGAAIPAPRQALRHQIDISTIAPDGASDTVGDRLRIRRQLRSMLNNTPLKLQSYLYIIYSDDEEQNGWYVPDFGQLTDVQDSAGLATGWWNLEQVAWIMAGHKRTNREGRNIWMKDLRAGQAWRDQLKLIYSIDFASLPTLQLSVMPSNSTSVRNAISGQVTPGVPLPAGRDGGICQLVTGQVDLSTLAYERPESAWGLSDTIVYDRRNNIGQFYRQTVLADGATSYYRTDETTGTVAVDQLGANPLTYTGGFTLGASGALGGSGDQDAAVTFNGTTGYAVAAAAALKITTPLTLEAWVKPTGVSTLQGITGRIDSGGPGYGLYILSTAFIWECNGTTVSAAATAGVWSHVVGTWDGSNLRLYINGALVAGPTAFAGPITSSASPFSIGSIVSGSFPLAGSVDEIAVYPSALSATQIRGHYNAGTSYDSGGNPVFYNGWEEAYGPDYPWSWNSTTPNPANADCPVLDNGLVRVRYDALGAGGVGYPGWRVDVWSSSAGGYVEQGKMTLQRIGDSTFQDVVWVQASLVEWTPDRAVLLVVLSNPQDVYSAERVYITMQRGELGLIFEAYPPLKAAGTPADAAFIWTPAPNVFVAGSGSLAIVPDVNVSTCKVDSQGTGNWTPGVPTATQSGGSSPGVFIATAGLGGGFGGDNSGGAYSTGPTTIGNPNFTTSENWVAILRYPTVYNVIGAYQHVLIPIQAAKAYCWYGASDLVYGVNGLSEVAIQSQTAAGYIQVQLQFGATVSQQVLEAEAMTLASGTSLATDASTASGPATNNTTSSTRTSLANHVSLGNWPNAFVGTYRVFVRVRVSAGTGSFRLGTTGTTVACSSTTYTWIDLGETTTNGTTTLVIQASTTTGTVFVDRMESVLVQDRNRTAAIYSGARDGGQAALTDSRCMGCLASR